MFSLAASTTEAAMLSATQSSGAFATARVGEADIPQQATSLAAETSPAAPAAYAATNGAESNNAEDNKPPITIPPGAKLKEVIDLLGLDPETFRGAVRIQRDKDGNVLFRYMVYSDASGKEFFVVGHRAFGTWEAMSWAYVWSRILPVMPKLLAQAGANAMGLMGLSKPAVGTAGRRIGGLAEEAAGGGLFNPADFVGSQAVVSPNLPAGQYPALVIDGKVYVARFHNVAWELAGRNRAKGGHPE